MRNITYEQFEYWCKKWDMTIEEGYRAMCFAANIVDQKFANLFDYAYKISKDNNHSDGFKKIVEKSKEDAAILQVFFASLEREIFNMLEEHDKEQTI